MKEKTKLENIEGFKELTEVQKEYFRVMQYEPEFMMAHDHPEKIEIICSIFIWTLYIFDAIYNNNVNIYTFFAVIYIIGFIIYAF